MRSNKIQFITFLLLFTTLLSTASAQKNRKPAYKFSDELELLKRVDLLPAYRTNEIIEQVSSYDRTGGNDDGFSGKYSYLRKEGNDLVIADFKGPGIINRIWTPTPTDELVSFFIDGEKKARLTLRFSDLFSGNVYPFLRPVCGNEAGGYYCYIPIPYNKSIKIVYHGPKLEFIQIQSRSMEGKNIESYTGNFSETDRQLLTDVCKIWSDITPSISNYTAGNSVDLKTEVKNFTIRPGETVEFFSKQSPGRIAGFEIDGGSSFDGTYKDVILSANWDNEKVEAIYAPVADYFGYAFGKSAMRSMIHGNHSTTNFSYFPMPFDKSASMRLIYKKRNETRQDPVSVTIRVYYNDLQRDAAKEGKFYSVWRREKPEKGNFYTFYTGKGKGHYVGTIHQAQGLRPGMTLFFEGDDSTNIDGKMRIHGTGSEDYYNGGWYALLDRWDRGVSLPLHGSLDYSLPMNRTGGYRIFLTDKMPWEKEIYHGMEHGPENNEFPVDYTSVAFLYGDSPLTSRMEPENNLREVYYPTEHVYFPQLMEATPGGGASVHQERGLRLIANHNHNMVRINLTDVPEGTYKLFISYFEKPDGADFSIWQRQIKLTDWKASKNDKEHLKEKVDAGVITITQQTNSITFHVRKNGNANQFELERIYLEKIK